MNKLKIAFYVVTALFVIAITVGVYYVVDIVSKRSQPELPPVIIVNNKNPAVEPKPIQPIKPSYDYGYDSYDYNM